MSRTTTLTGVITLATKKIVLTEQVAIREQIDLSFTGFGTAGAADLICAIVYEGALMAKLQPMTGGGGGPLTGVLDLNTTQIVAPFANMAANARIKMVLVIWDVTNADCLLNDFIWIENNPFAVGMVDPTPVAPITPGTYALIANGVQGGSGHVHQTGDGGDLTPYFIARVPAGGFFRQSSDGLDIVLCDRLTGEWKPLILYNGSLSTGPAE